MATEAVASSSTEGLTPAQQLMEQHDHHVTVEDVVDEEDIIHPPPSASKPSTPDVSATPLSEKAAGKRKADDSGAPTPKSGQLPLNTASEEAFPALGPIKPRVQAPAPTWGKKPAAVTSNGISGSNNTSRASTPGPALPTMNIPGQYNESIRFSPNQLTPRKDLKKPINEIIREINRRSKAKLEMKQLGGMIVFESTGPVDAVRQSLKDIANEVGSKVSCLHTL